MPETDCSPSSLLVRQRWDSIPSLSRKSATQCECGSPWAWTWTRRHYATHTHASFANNFLFANLSQTRLLRDCSWPNQNHVSRLRRRLGGTDDLTWLDFDYPENRNTQIDRYSNESRVECGRKGKGSKTDRVWPPFDPRPLSHPSSSVYIVIVL